MKNSKKIILFDGSNLDQWQMKDGSPATWTLKDGAMTTTTGNIISKVQFKDARIHVEFSTPDMPDAKGQAKGNSGVFLQGRYEIQVLDSYGFETPGQGDCGAFYQQHAPLVNACKPAIEWQTYDIFFRAPRVDEQTGMVTENARATVLQNGEIIHNNVELNGPTGGQLDNDLTKPGPLMLQFHGNDVRYRNIWLLELPLKGSELYEPK